jgi:uncharacterized protein YqhQ
MGTLYLKNVDEALKRDLLLLAYEKDMSVRKMIEPVLQAHVNEHRKILNWRKSFERGDL